MLDCLCCESCSNFSDSLASSQIWLALGDVSGGFLILACNWLSAVLYLRILTYSWLYDKGWTLTLGIHDIREFFLGSLGYLQILLRDPGILCKEALHSQTLTLPVSYLTVTQTLNSPVSSGSMHCGRPKVIKMVVFPSRQMGCFLLRTWWQSYAFPVAQR